MSNLSRRRLVASAAALPALGVSAGAFASVPVAVDPIYAAIAAHRTAYLEFNTNPVDEDDPRYDKEMRRLSDAEEAAVWNLTQIQPTTPAGAIALLRQVSEIEALDYHYSFEDDADGKIKPFSYFALPNVIAALEAVQS